MTFDIREFSHVPATMLVALVQVLIGIALVIGGRTTWRRGGIGRAIGGVLLGMAAIWYFLTSYGFLRDGVIWNQWTWWPSDRPGEWRLAGWADKLFVFSWVLVSVAIMVPVLRPKRAVV